MKSIYSFVLFMILFFSLALNAQIEKQNAAVTWQNFSSNFNILAVSHSGSKPLQYNDELDLLSFVQRISPYYISTPAPSPFAASGVIVGYLSNNWGLNWDSTCIWSKNAFAGRYPQGAVYNPPGNTVLSNAYLLGTGPYIDTMLVWAGNWSASKQLGSANYNTSASVLPNAQQILPTEPPLPVFGRCHFSRNSFASTDDGKLHSLARLGDLNSPGFRGAMVLKASYNNGTFDWTGDSLECPTHFNTPYYKVVDPEPLMAWNENGTVGYVVFIGSRDGGLVSNFGMQPIVYKTINSGMSWQLVPSMDFNSPSAQNLLNLLPTVNAFSPNPNLTIPNLIPREGWDVVVDKNNALHIVALINGAVSSNIDSIYNRHNYGIEGYDWQHTPGRRPYLTDFILSHSQSWSYGIVDSLSSETTGALPFTPGNGYNTWGINGVSNLSRIQCSRTPDGRFVLITWAESDTAATPSAIKWNTLPQLKARLIDTDTYGLSTSEIDLSTGTNISTMASMHFVAPRCASATINVNTIDIKLPVTVSNNPGQIGLLNSSNWFAAAELGFSYPTIPFTQAINSYYVGINESKVNSENLFELYPNPFHSSFKLKSLMQGNDKNKLEIFDLSGRKLFTETYSGGEHEINMGAFSTGTYILRVSSNEGALYKKIVKE